MEDQRSEKKKLSRKGFIRLCGSVVAGGVIAGGTGNLLWKMFKNPDDIFYDGTDEKVAKVKSTFKPAYRKLSAFSIDDEIEAFEATDDYIVVAAANNLNIYDHSGQLLINAAVGSDIRDLAISADELYVLFSTRIEVYDLQVNLLRDWDACSDDSDYCSLTVMDGQVWVTDASSKNICRYTDQGELRGFTDSPKGFVVPSYSFGITHGGGVVYVTNPGRHLIESYDADGNFLTAFGEAGLEGGHFSGCCNPVYVTIAPNGELLTSEKGIPRISCYSPSGEYRSVLLDQQTMGGGHDAYEVRVVNADKIAVSGRKTISLFQYDRNLAQASYGAGLQGSSCALCEIECPLRV